MTLGARVVPLGSSSVKTTDVLLGDACLYVHAGGQHEWDSAALVAVAHAWGLHASRLDGSPREIRPDVGRRRWTAPLSPPPDCF
ncbi:inositol monophosphatase family protein [Streptomyces sp. AS58]|uniref:inositol monophosphatase family protein n=1 Tax=Streptomyces sp. AS58 TaxID=1519489 RepID=UPI000D147B61